jgi:hypothetical protein
VRTARTIAIPPATVRSPRAPANDLPARSRHGEVQYGSRMRRGLGGMRRACLEGIVE